MAVATTGFFDGVHRGHASVIRQLVETARAKGEESVVVTFWPHPRGVLRQDAQRLRLLTSQKEKEELLKAMGVDRIYVVPFTRALSNLSSEEFIDKYLIEELGVTTLIVGYDHRLGKRTEGKGDNIALVARSKGIEAMKVNAVSDTYNTISSTYIRNLIETGGIERANDLLGYEYTLNGVVVSGEGKGRQMGFPTANTQLYEPLKLIPENGVYAVWVTVEGQKHLGVCNIGVRPTMNDGRGTVIEAHILDFNDDIYGLEISLQLVGRLRDEICFASVEQLKEQMAKDVECARTLLNR